MKINGSTILMVLIFVFFVFGIFYIDNSGYYRVTMEKGANVYNSVFVSGDSIDVLPFDTVVKIEPFGEYSSYEMHVDGQTLYVKKTDFELVKRTYDIWGVVQYFVYFIILCIALNMGYKYLRKNNVRLLSQLKTALYVIITLAIFGWMIFLLNNPSSPPSLNSRAKNMIAIQMDIDGFEPSTDSEVDVLCHYDGYKYLVRDEYHNQFVVPAGGLKNKVESLSDLNEKFTYNVSKEKVDSYMGKDILQFAREVGSYVTGVGMMYEFPYLVAIGNGERVQGVTVLTNMAGVIQSILYNEEEKSSNIFNKLPFYETIACKNLYVSTGITGDNSFWERLLAVVVNFFLMGFVILMVARTASVISYWAGEKSFNVKRSVKIIIWVICAPFIYIYTLALLDFYHSWWILVLLYILSIIIETFGIGTDDAAKSIYKCPSCLKNGAYAPTEKVISRTIAKTSYSWNRGKTEYNIRIPEKTYTMDIKYIMVGACKECGYEDKNTYVRQETRTRDTTCPMCDSKLKVSAENNVYYEKCPNCDYSLIISEVRSGNEKKESPVIPYSEEEERKEQKRREREEQERKEKERREEEDRNFRKHEKEDALRRAEKELEEAEKRNKLGYDDEVKRHIDEAEKDIEEAEDIDKKYL